MNNSINQRVFITGLSALTACGNTINDTWHAILSGKSGISELNQWDLSSWRSRLGGELKDFEPTRMLPDRKLLKVVSRQDIIGLNAAMQAIDHSDMMSYRNKLNYKINLQKLFDDNTAIYVGSPGNKYYQQYDFLPLLAKTNDDMHQFAQQLFYEVHPMWLLRILPNNVLAYIGITYGFKGSNHNITNHAVSGTQALLEAYYAIKSGQAERAVVVAYDVPIEPQALFYYDKLGVISPHHLKPFDKEHDGTLLAEGAAAIVLESEASADDRSATCYAEVIGGFSTSEAFGLFSLDEQGKELTKLLQKTFDEYHINSIDMITAHGNGNKKSDDSEAQAICSIFASHCPPVTAFKWAMGHTICASGVLDAVLTTYALRNQCVPGIATFSNIANNCIGLNVSAKHRFLSNKCQYALVINRGFASMNACLVLKSCD